MAQAMKIAIVDDEQDMRQSISQWLALSGYDTETFASAMKGVKLNWKLPDLAPPDLGPGQPARPVSEKKGRQKQQAEFDRPGRYFPQKGLKYITKLGRDQKAKWKDTLAAIEEKYGVPVTPRL